MVEIRLEQSEDVTAVRQVNEAAFGRPGEADLVDRLRERGVVTLSLVAEQDGEVAGHILFSPVTITEQDSVVTTVGLGPMAVLPARQSQGVGSKLVQTGLEMLRQAGHDLVIVLGHPDYYPRFGFAPAGRHGIHWENEVPDEVFMVLALRPGALDGVSGIVRYQPEFSEV
jgi:putative acetyltransferase